MSYSFLANKVLECFFKSRTYFEQYYPYKVIGITEPAMYGVTLKLKRPLYAAMIGGGVTGIFFNIFPVKNFGLAMPGVTALPGYVDTATNKNFVFALIGAILAFVVALIATLILGVEDEKAPSKTRKNS